MVDMTPIAIQVTAPTGENPDDQPLRCLKLWVRMNSQPGRNVDQRLSDRPLLDFDECVAYRRATLSKEIQNGTTTCSTSGVLRFNGVVACVNRSGTTGSEER